MTTLASRGQLRASFIRWALFTVPVCLLLGVLPGRIWTADSEWFRDALRHEGLLQDRVLRKLCPRSLVRKSANYKS